MLEGLLKVNSTNSSNVIGHPTAYLPTERHELGSKRPFDEYFQFALFSFVCRALLEIQFVLEDLRMKSEAANWICLVL